MTQDELALEYATYDHYTVTLATGLLHEEKVLRTHTAHSVVDAEGLIEGLRDTAAQRDHVTWRDETVDNAGVLYGLDDHQTVWVLKVVPALSVALTV